MFLVLPQPLQLPEASDCGLGRSLLTAGLVMGAVPAAETAAANSSLNTLMRSIGTSAAGAGSPGDRRRSGEPAGQRAWRSAGASRTDPWSCR